MNLRLSSGQELPERITLACSGRMSAAEGGQRLLTGTVTTFGQVMYPSWPPVAVRMMPASVDIPEQTGAVKLLDDHDPRALLGSAVTVTDHGPTLSASLAVGRTKRGDDVLSLAADGHLDSWSAGYDLIDFAEVTEDGQTVLNVTRALLREVSVVTWGADPTARIETVNASQRSTPVMNVALPQAAPPAAPAVAAQFAPAGAAPAPASPASVMTTIPAVFTAADYDALAQGIAERMSAAAAPAADALSEHRTTTGAPVAVRASDRAPSKYAGVWTPGGQFVTAGDYLATFAHAHREGDWSKLRELRAQLAAADASSGAVAQDTTSDVPGLLPRQIIGNLLGRASGRRQVWNSLTSREMPMAGAKFDRPMIKQHVITGPQAAEFDQVVSQKFTVDLEAVPKRTEAGVLDLSRQALDWTSPSLMNEVVSDFVKIYIARTDMIAAADLVTSAQGDAVVWDGKAATLNLALALAAGRVYGSLGPEVDTFPNTLWCSVDMWVKLAGLNDSTGRPLIPHLGPVNATGTMNLADPERGIDSTGFRWVVDKHLPNGTLIMGDREYTESYENGRRFLEAQAPASLSLQLAYMGYVATYFPYPKSLVPITFKGSGTAAVTAAVENEV